MSVLIQAIAVLAYLVFACLMLFLWPNYKLSIKNLILFVGFGAAGIMIFAVLGVIWANEQNAIESRALVIFYLCTLLLGLLGGSYVGLRVFGTKSGSR